MQCTGCKGSYLEPTEMEPGLIGAACRECGGVLLSLLNYRFWVERRFVQQPVQDALEMAEEVHQLPEDHAGVRCCPKCSRLMLKYQVGLNAENKLDLCTACDEAWLDKGEWQLLKQLDLQGKLPRSFTDAWQRNIRKERRAAQQKDRYQSLIGAEDFLRMDEFRNWLYQHPHREEIKVFISQSPD